MHAAEAVSSPLSIISPGDVGGGGGVTDRATRGACSAGSGMVRCTTSLGLRPSHDAPITVSDLCGVEPLRDGQAHHTSHFRQSRARARCSAARTSSPARCRIQYWLGTRSIMPLARVRGNNPTSCWGAGPKHVPPYSCMRPWDDTSHSAECRWRATSAEQRAEHIGRNPERPAQEDEARPSNDHRGKGDSKDATAVSTLGGQSQQCTNLPPAARL